MRFRDLGVAVDAVESRTAAVCTNTDGESRVVIAAKGFLLVFDPISRACHQVPFPDGFCDYPYQCFSSADGMFYTGAGPMFYGFDPFRLEMAVAEHVGASDEIIGFSYAEDSEGAIWFTSYPRCQLYRYQPAEQRVESCGSMDAEQKYPSHLAMDDGGTLYMGVGTARRKVIVYHPAIGRREEVALMGAYAESTGIGIVRQDVDGRVHIEEEPGLWVIYREGKPTGASGEEPLSHYSGSSFQSIHRQLPGDWQIVSHSLSERRLRLRHRLSGEVQIAALDYVSEGAQLSPLTLGPDGQIYGTSNHPLHFYSYAPGDDRLTNHGPGVIEHGSGGNICAYAAQGDVLAGVVYAGGYLHLYDTSRPMVLSMDSDKRNPRWVTKHKEIHRPRCAIALGDGRTIVYGGFPGYGDVGGGLCFYDVRSGEEKLLTHEQLIRYQSTVSVALDRTGSLVGGTSIETPGGAEPKASHACIYRLDTQTQQVIAQWSPDPAIREYAQLMVDEAGRIHVISSCSQYIVWDPERGKEVMRRDCSDWGKVVRQGMAYVPEHRSMIGVLSEAIFCVDTDSLEIRLLAAPPTPITSGLALAADTIYYGSGSHLWCCCLDQGKEN